jgi:hypothetical protein
MHGCRWGYPAARERGWSEPPAQASRFPRYESMAADVASIDTDAELITFSGRADSVRLSARTNGARFTLTDRLNRETHFVVVLAGLTDTVDIPCERVLVRSHVAGAAASCFVTGMFAAPADLVEGDEASYQRGA